MVSADVPMWMQRELIGSFRMHPRVAIGALHAGPLRNAAGRSQGSPTGAAPQVRPWQVAMDATLEHTRGGTHWVACLRGRLGRAGGISAAGSLVTARRLYIIPV